MPTTSEAWQALHLDRHDWGLAPFISLLTGEVACLVFDDFCPREACGAIAENVQRLGLTRSFTGENVEASFSGLAAIEFADRKEEYLAAVDDANRDRRRLLGDQ